MILLIGGMYHEKNNFICIFCFFVPGNRTPCPRKNSKTLLITRPQEEIRKTEFFEYFSSLYEINPTKVFDLVDTAAGYRKYTTAGLKEYGIKDANAIYSFYDTHYDQDDYDYIGYTKEELTKNYWNPFQMPKKFSKRKLNKKKLLETITRYVI